MVGVSRSPFSSESWREALKGSTRKFSNGFDEQVWADFEKRVHYVPGDIAKTEDFVRLRRELDRLEGGQESTRVYYLSTSPTLYPAAIRHLGKGTPLHWTEVSSRRFWAMIADALLLRSPLVPTLKRPRS